MYLGAVRDVNKPFVLRGALNLLKVEVSSE